MVLRSSSRRGRVVFMATVALLTAAPQRPVPRPTFTPTKGAITPRTSMAFSKWRLATKSLIASLCTLITRLSGQGRSSR